MYEVKVRVISVIFQNEHKMTPLHLLLTIYNGGILFSCSHHSNGSMKINKTSKIFIVYSKTRENMKGSYTHRGKNGTNTGKNSGPQWFTDFSFV